MLDQYWLALAQHQSSFVRISGLCFGTFSLFYTTCIGTVHVMEDFREFMQIHVLTVKGKLKKVAGLDQSCSDLMFLAVKVGWVLAIHHHSCFTSGRNFSVNSRKSVNFLSKLSSKHS